MELWMINTIMRVGNMTEEEVLALPWESQLYLFSYAYLYEQLMEVVEQNRRDEAKKPKRN